MDSDDMIQEIQSGQVPGGSVLWRKLLGALMLASVAEVEHANSIMDFVRKELDNWYTGKYPRTSSEALKEA